MDVNEHERLSNLTLIHKFSKKRYGCKWTWDYPILHFDTNLVRKDMDINEHVRLSNFTLRHKFSKKGYGFKWTRETIQFYT